MLIDPFSPNLEQGIRQQYELLPESAQLLMLLDGAFVPGLFRELYAQDPVLLFDSFPGLTEEVKDVSPFLLRYDPSKPALAQLLKRCSGWPMISMISTFESTNEVSTRLSAWCIVEASGQRFNFRFPDTRRLPAIFDTLTDDQRAEMAGSAFSWLYVGRNGEWQSLKIKHSIIPRAVTVRAQLNDMQFNKLVGDSEADEVWALLQDRGEQSILMPSQRHALLHNALWVAGEDGLPDYLKLRWCSNCLSWSNEISEGTIHRRYADWRELNMRKADEISRHIS